MNTGFVDPRDLRFTMRASQPVLPTRIELVPPGYQPGARPSSYKSDLWTDGESNPARIACKAFLHPSDSALENGRARHSPSRQKSPRSRPRPKPGSTCTLPRLWTRSDLNRPPLGCEPSALPDELRALAVRDEGIEPPASCESCRRSTVEPIAHHFAFATQTRSGRFRPSSFCSSSSESFSDFNIFSMVFS